MKEFPGHAVKKSRETRHVPAVFANRIPVKDACIRNPDSENLKKCLFKGLRTVSVMIVLCCQNHILKG
jgi:hypothetical protein